MQMHFIQFYSVRVHMHVDSMGLRPLMWILIASVSGLCVQRAVVHNRAHAKTETSLSFHPYCLPAVGSWLKVGHRAAEGLYAAKCLC